MRRLLAVLFLLFAAATPASASEADRCTPDHAVRMSVHDAYWYDGPDICVRLQGLIAWRGMYASTHAYYEQRNAHRVRGMERETIGIYANNDADGDRLWSMRSVVDAFGLLTTCRRMYDRATDSQPPVTVRKNGQTETIVITMMSGLCHYQGGTAMVVSSYDTLPNASARFSGPDSARLYGDLHQFEPSPEQRSDAETWLAKNASAIHNGDTLSSITYLAYEDDDNSMNYVCVCTRGDCTNQWPISYGDVGPQSDPPYRCGLLGTYGVSDAC